MFRYEVSVLILRSVHRYVTCKRNLHKHIYVLDRRFFGLSVLSEKPFGVLSVISLYNVRKWALARESNVAQMHFR